MSRLDTDRRPWIALLAAMVVLGACGGGSAADTSESPSTTAPTTSTVPTDDVDAGPDDTTTTTAAETDPWAGVFPEIMLDPTEAGPRPLLSWTPVDSAALYQLTVLDSDGVPYWAWSGTETSVPLGGMDDPDAIGAWVFEPLRWTVVARNGEGQPLAMSRQATLEP